MAARPIVGLVGRQDSLDFLAACRDRARLGHPGLVVVAGEMGVGKTRLVTEFLRDQSAPAVVGACVPVAGEALPLAALAQGLRRLRPGSGREVLEAAPELLRLLPSPAPPAAGAGAFDALRLFQAVLALLDDLGRREAVVWVVEDLHWADPTTLDLIRFVASNLTREHALVLLTYRTDDVIERSALHAWLAQLRRLPRVEHLPLQRLDRHDAAQLVRSLSPRDTDARILGSIVTRAAGNPLFAQHLVWQSTDREGPLPDALSDLLGYRLTMLAAATRALVAAASVLARPVPLELLVATCADLEGDPARPPAQPAVWPCEQPPMQTSEQLPAQGGDDALQDAVDHHVLRVTGEGLVEFHHPAFREVAYASLLPTRRAALHRAAARALAGGVAGGETNPGELARHWHLAGDLPRALEASLRAGYAAEQIPAFADAATNFRRALDLADRLGSDLDRLDLLRHTARAARLLGDDEEALTLLRRALELAPDARSRADVLEELGHVHLMAGRGPQARTALREALGLLPPHEESALVARVHAELGLLAATWSRPAEAEQASRRALAVAAAVGAEREKGRAHNALGLIAASRGDHEEAVEHLRLALVAAQDCADADDLCAAYVNLTHVLGLAGQDEEVVEVAAQGVEVITQLGLARQTGTLLMANLTESLIRLGRYAGAREVVERALGLRPQGIIAAPTLLRAALLDVFAGDPAGATRRCEQAREMVPATQAPASWLRELAEVRAEVELWSGRPRAAFDVVVEGLRSMEPSACDSEGLSLHCLGLRALADLAETARSPADFADRDRRYRDLVDLTATQPRLPRLGDPPQVRAWIATVTAERARARRQHASQTWTRAREAWAEAARPYETLYTLWREAEARLGERVDEAAIAALRSAGERARDLGIVPIAQEVELLARWYRVDLSPEHPELLDDPERRSAQAAIASYRLTPRELEVLEGLAAGRTNSELAGHLGISVKTASVHVSNILHKLDVPVRQDAARLAHRLGVGRAEEAAEEGDRQGAREGTSRR